MRNLDVSSVATSDTATAASTDMDVSFVHVPSNVDVDDSGNVPALLVSTSPKHDVGGLGSGLSKTQACVNMKAWDLPDDDSQREPVDIVVALDVSGSMTGEKLNLSKKTLDLLPAAVGLAFQEMRQIRDPKEVQLFSALDDTVKEHEETIKTLRSDMAKMSSTYKQDSYLKRKEIAKLKQRNAEYEQDSYLKRKEIAKLKQQNAEYALKLRALEKAFKCVNSTEGMSVVGQRFHGHTTHGSPRSSHGGPGSAHGRSMHSVDSLQSKEDKAAAVKARLGLAPYEFPSAAQPNQDSLIVQQANFFDGLSDGGSDLGGKGENPEEC